MQPVAPTTIGDRYRLGPVLGAGGMSVVHLATDLRTGQQVAIKRVRSSWMTDEELRRRHEHEVRLIAELAHPNIVAMSDCGTDDGGHPFFVMERLHGVTLQRLLQVRGTLSLDETLRTMLPVMGALAYAHGQGIVHRDLKPDNIFLSRDTQGSVVPKLLDFGIAVRLAGSSTRLTRSGIVIGSAPYISPEQACDEPISARSDVWSLAAVLFRCLAGEPPHSGSDMAEILMKIVREPAPTLASLAPRLNRRVAAVIDRALLRAAERRFSDMGEFAHALLATARGQGIALSRSADPVGLAGWQDWQATASSSDEATAPVPTLPGRALAHS